MAKPKHRRCAECDVVTSRYSHTVAQGALSLKVWVRDERNGSVQGADGKPYCQAHAEEAAGARALAPDGTDATRIHEDDPRDVHPLSCAVWNSNDPCDCPADRDFEAGVQAKLDRFESYAAGN